jgi:hypothetical protein
MFIPEIQGIIFHNKFFTLSTSVFSDIYAQVYYIRFFIVPIYSTLFHQHRTIFLPISLQYFFYPVSPHHRTLFRHFFVSISSYCLHLHLRLDITEKFLASTYLLYFFRSHSTLYLPVFSFFVLFSIVLSRCYSKPVKPQCPLPPLASCSVPLPFRCPGSPSAARIQTERTIMLN